MKQFEYSFQRCYHVTGRFELGVRERVSRLIDVSMSNEKGKLDVWNFLPLSPSVRMPSLPYRRSS